MEAAGIAPASREASATASTCVAVHLIVGLVSPIGRVRFGLAGHEFNPSRNQRLSSSDPALASPAESSGRRLGARPLLFFRQRDGDQQCCWQLSFGRLFTRPADQPRHATRRFGHPVDPGSPPLKDHQQNRPRQFGRIFVIISSSDPPSTPRRSGTSDSVIGRRGKHAQRNRPGGDHGLAFREKSDQDDERSRSPRPAALSLIRDNHSFRVPADPRRSPP